VEASPAKNRCREVPMAQGPIDWGYEIAGSAFGSAPSDVCRLPRDAHAMQSTGLGVAVVCMPVVPCSACRCDDVKGKSIICRLTSGDMGLLTGPHQMLSLELSSSTTRLSEGERPVLAPE
jgi:hypothetical protein